MKGRAFALAAWVIVAAAFSFWPFRVEYRGPRHADNGATLRADGTMALRSPAVARTEAAPPWLPKAIAARSLDLRVEARTARAGQHGPARLVTVSNGAYLRNVTVAQKGVDLVVRVRRPGSDENGAAPLKVDGVFSEPAWKAIDVAVRENEVAVSVDGERRARETFDTNVFATWDPTFRLALGDEVDGARGWDGELRAATAVVGDTTHDLLAPDATERPATFWDVPEVARRLARFDHSWLAVVAGIHLLLFVPLGWLLAARGGRFGPVAALLLGALLGALLQVGKLGFAERHPSLYHAIPDALGAGIGALVARSTKKS